MMTDAIDAAPPLKCPRRRRHVDDEDDDNDASEAMMTTMAAMTTTTATEPPNPLLLDRLPHDLLVKVASAALRAFDLRALRALIMNKSLNKALREAIGSDLLAELERSTDPYDRHVLAELLKRTARTSPDAPRSAAALRGAYYDYLTARDVAIDAIRERGRAVWDALHPRADGPWDGWVVKDRWREMESAFGNLRGGDWEALRADREVVRAYRQQVLAALRRNGLALRHASPELIDREMLLTAVKQNGMALRIASTEQRADKELVLEAVKQDGMALEIAPTELRADKEVVRAAVRRNELEFALRKLRKLRADRKAVVSAAQISTERELHV